MNSTQTKPNTSGGSARTNTRSPGANNRGRGGPRSGASGDNTRAKNSRRPRGARPERARPEFEQKVLDVRRVTRVVAGGRRFAFSVILAIGNKRGAVGVGVGKASDTALAMEKAYNNAKKHLYHIKTTEGMSIPFDVKAKYSSAEIVILPAPGRGLSAGSAARNIFELGGITDVSSKILTRSKNKLNIARATIKALSQLES